MLKGTLHNTHRIDPLNALKDHLAHVKFYLRTVVFIDDKNINDKEDW
jgi:hypothetical protein